jgi:hypothetical protein
VISIVPLWERVARVAWGDETCVQGSTVGNGGRIGDGTVPFGPQAMSNVIIPQSPGVIKGGRTMQSAEPSATGSSTSGGSKPQVCGGLILALLWALLPVRGF